MVSLHTSKDLGVGSGKECPIASGRPMLRDLLVCGSWSVKGLTDLKCCELIRHKQEFDLDILCLQETFASNSSVEMENGYLVVLSGTDAGVRCWAGVGFIVLPRCAAAIKSFKQVSDRICCIKLRVCGGVVGIITAYAPHNGRPLDGCFEVVG